MESLRFNLEQHDLLQFKGPDSEKFLQGQLTCDLASLAEMQFCEGAACNNKGRVIADFRLFKLPDSLLLELAPGTGDILTGTLTKFLPFYQSEMKELDDSMIIGLGGAETEQLLLEELGELPREQSIIKHGKELLICIAKTQQRYMLISPKEENIAPLRLAITRIEEGGYDIWRYLDTQSGIFHVSPETSGLYTPQELNFDIRGLVSFNKGCYTGQEIVRRMHYRGNQDKRLYHLWTESYDESPEQLQNNEISDAVGKIKGQVINALREPGSSRIDVLAIFNKSPLKSELALTADPRVRFQSLQHQAPDELPQR